MGSDLLVNDAPRFWVWAVQDPAGPPLDRIQIVKGWVENGEQRQRVWDVACSNGRLPGASGKCPKTTADVNLESCERTGKEGATELTLLANSADKDLPDDLPATLQERGWSSPIWSSSRK
jgi:hypothetical protein